MTPSRLSHLRDLWLHLSDIERELVEEMERMQIAFDGIVTLHDVNLRELERANSQQVHCAACGGVECHRLAEIVKLTGMESDQHMVEWVEQAKQALTMIKGPAYGFMPTMQEMVQIATAALTVPPAPQDSEREAWLDGRARVKPAKEKP